MEPAGQPPFFLGNTGNPPWEETAPGVRRKILAHDAQLMIVRISFDKGAIGALHQHFHTQITYVESGIFLYEINGITQTLHKGDIAFVPPNALHGVVCEEAGVLVDVFSPRRDSFL